jgi:spore coat protein CotF
MANNKICCEEVNVDETIDLNDRDYLNDILYNEKNILVNTTTALTEASNEKLQKEIQDIFNTIYKLQSSSYELAWNNGWYILEESEKNKINQKAKELQKKLDELSK